MFVKITSLATLPNYTLLVGFSTGEYKLFDLKPYIEKYKPFEALKTVNGLYEQAKIDVGGYGIFWNDELDVSADGIFEKGVACSEPQSVESNRNKILTELTQVRINAGVSQKQLEALSGIAQPCIARTEKGITDPQLSTLLKMLEPLGFTLELKKL